MPTYEHLCKDCDHEWEDFYSMMKDPPTICPSCEKEGKVIRLISGGSGRGIVRLTGGDLRAQILVDAGKARQRAKTDENFRASIIGEQKYHQQQLSSEGLSSELVKIGKKSVNTKSGNSKNSVVRRVGSK